MAISTPATSRKEELVRDIFREESKVGTLYDLIPEKKYDDATSSCSSDTAIVRKTFEEFGEELALNFFQRGSTIFFLRNFFYSQLGRIKTPELSIYKAIISCGIGETEEISNSIFAEMIGRISGYTARVLLRSNPDDEVPGSRHAFFILADKKEDFASLETSLKGRIRPFFTPDIIGSVKGGLFVDPIFKEIRPTEEISACTGFIDYVEKFKLKFAVSVNVVPHTAAYLNAIKIGARALKSTLPKRLGESREFLIKSTNVYKEALELAEKTSQSTLTALRRDFSKLTWSKSANLFFGKGELAEIRNAEETLVSEDREVFTGTNSAGISIILFR